MGDNISSQYLYRDASPSPSHAYLWPALRQILTDASIGARARILDLGCGNGCTASMLSELGHDVTGVDPSTSGVAAASRAFPRCRFVQGSAYDDLAAQLGTFDVIVSLEVIEHCFWPRRVVDCVVALLKPGGLLVMSTPYHGYVKNLAIALVNGFDAHWSALWDGGHIKFWSEATLRSLLIERGLEGIHFMRVGRIPQLAKSMVAIALKPTLAGGEYRQHRRTQTSPSTRKL